MKKEVATVMSLDQIVQAVKQRILAWLKERAECLYALKDVAEEANHTVRFALGNQGSRKLTSLQKDEATSLITRLCTEFGINCEKKKDDDLTVVWWLVIPKVT